MSAPARILIQLDSDLHASVFDSIVAIDSGIDRLLPFSTVEPTEVRDLVHGALFTRGADRLKHTAIFIGGADVLRGEQLLRAVADSFFGPLRVSVMLDAGGANTTAAATVLRAQQHLDLNGMTIAVLGASGSVGRRVCHLLARVGARVKAVSRDLERAQQVCEELRATDPQADLHGATMNGPGGIAVILQGCDGVVSAGAAGAQLVSQTEWQSAERLQMLIDLNAVPPAGIEGVDPMDSGRSLGEATVYGAIGVGNLKMKIHRRCLQTLFESNEHVLDLAEIYDVGQQSLD